jgi:oligosaccharyltransferase complex subunit beta
LSSRSRSAFSPSLSPKAIVDAQFSGLNTLYLLSPNISEIHRDTFREYDLEFVERDTTLLDAFSPLSSTSQSQSTVVLSPSSCLSNSPNVLSPTTLTGGPIIYPQGTVHTLGQNPYIVEVAHAPKTAYVGEERSLDADEKDVEASVGGGAGKSKEGIVTGKKAALVSAFQARDNSRVGFVGSGKMLSDEYWGKEVNLDGKR